MYLTKFRTAALLVLVLLAGPLAAHVITHDLDHYESHGSFTLQESGHGTHEHPVLTSAAASIAKSPRNMVAPVTVQHIPAVAVDCTTAGRNVISFGAVRIDDDVGLHALLSTFLI